MRQEIEIISKIIKERFPNLGVAEVLKLTLDIHEALEELKKKRVENS